MYLYEVIAHKRMIDKKISEVKLAIENKQDDSLAKELISLLELKQTKLININIANNSSSINFGDTEISIASAVIIRDSIKEKISILTDIINLDSNLDKLTLMKQRDSYFEEYLLLNMMISKNDLNLTLG